ncbi:GNAT family N-acetyltransferase [Defluviimonas sp. SAOS-178_SWC]|uniref:GNAT family N-acetyltransferase n=1 Tax=Defluviimonas sp. SAOS-178_SWC TaxID=3121287 RepID=UPI003221CCF4
MTDAATLRRFRPGDAAETREVFWEAVRIGAADHYTEAQLADWVADPEMPDDWGDWLDRHFTVVAEDESGRIAGFFMLEASGYLNMAFVRPEWRQTGLADRLHAAILAEARAQGMPRLTVWASRLARRFLARHGWTLDSEPPPLSGHPVPTGDAEPIDVAMKLDLVAATVRAPDPHATK